MFLDSKFFMFLSFCSIRYMFPVSRCLEKAYYRFYLLCCDQFFIRDDCTVWWYSCGIDLFFLALVVVALFWRWPVGSYILSSALFSVCIFLRFPVSSLLLIYLPPYLPCFFRFSGTSPPSVGSSLPPFWPRSAGPSRFSLPGSSGM